MGDKTPARRVTLTEEHDKWLRRHPEINISGLLRIKIDEYIELSKHLKHDSED